MKIDLIVVGKIKDKNLSCLIQEYLKRLSGYATLNIVEVADESMSERPNDFEISKAIENEGARILKKIDKANYVVIFDLVDKQLDSVQFASYLQQKLDRYGSHICFVIGGSYGLSNEVKKRANDAISLSRMTFTHQMARLIVIEQIYRAFKINHNEVYHK